MTKIPALLLSWQLGEYYIADEKFVGLTIEKKADVGHSQGGFLHLQKSHQTLCGSCYVCYVSPVHATHIAYWQSD